MKVATHNGTFHADDVMSASILMLAEDDVFFIRTRDTNLLNTAYICFCFRQQIKNLV